MMTRGDLLNRIKGELADEANEHKKQLECTIEA